MIRKNRISPLMEAMKSKVESLEDTFINNNDILKHSFEIDIDKIEPNPNQPRRNFNEKSLQEMATTLQEHGQITPIIVKNNPDYRSKWIIIAGERRWRAAKIAGIKTLTAIEREEMTDVIALIENIQREDLSPVEEAKSVASIAEIYKWSQRELAKKLGKGLSEINGILSITKLPEDFLNGVLNSEHHLSKNLLIELSRITNHDVQKKLCKEALEGQLTIPKIRLYSLEKK